MRPLTAIDVCGGAGGWAVAARGLPIRVVAAFDQAEDCLATYGRNHPGVELVLGDVTTQDLRKWKGVDLILGGIPCEQISAARRCRPLADNDREAWQSLVARFLGLPTELGAAWWCYEDVRDILRFVPTGTPHFTLDSQDFSRQRRKRAYLGNLPPPLKLSFDPRTFAHAMRPGPHRVNPRLLERKPGRSFTYGGDPKRRDELEKRFYPWEPREKSPTVTALDSRHDNYAAARLPDGSGWRQIEWQELAVLQGFPPDYVFMGSAGRVTKMVAQAVQIDTGRAILQGLCSRVYDL
jgi:site-specific DNA-cytosine methylase